MTRLAGVRVVGSVLEPEAVGSSFVAPAGRSVLDRDPQRRPAGAMAICSTMAAGTGVLAGPQAAAGISHALTASAVLALVASLR